MTPVAFLLTAAMLMAACGGGGADSTVVVSAASSLTDAFTELEAAFEQANPGVEVTLNLGGSSALREQIIGGADIDVFASANAANMDRVVEAGLLAAAPELFAFNLLQIAVPAGNPAGVRGLEDFSNVELLIGLCAEAVPCGSLARMVLDAAGVNPALDTNEPNVRSLVTKIETGELDAGIVYVTDVISGGSAVTGIVIPDRFNTQARYEIAPLARSATVEASAFVAFVLSNEGREILTANGFATP